MCIRFIEVKPRKFEKTTWKANMGSWQNKIMTEEEEILHIFQEIKQARMYWLR